MTVEGISWHPYPLIRGFGNDDVNDCPESSNRGDDDFRIDRSTLSHGLRRSKFQLQRETDFNELFSGSKEINFIWKRSRSKWSANKLIAKNIGLFIYTWPGIRLPPPPKNFCPGDKNSLNFLLVAKHQTPSNCWQTWFLFDSFRIWINSYIRKGNTDLQW